MKCLLAFALILSSSTVFAKAEIKKGPISVLVSSEQFGSLLIQGEAAQLIFNKLQVEEKQHSAINTLGDFSSKTSLDGRLSCEKYTESGRVDCRQFFNPSTGDSLKYQPGY